MPAISMFFGVIITMYHSDHQPPHFHARYQGVEATFDFDGNCKSGKKTFPVAQRKYVEAWALIHREELMANWEIAKEKGRIFHIDPLR